MFKYLFFSKEGRSYTWKKKATLNINFELFLHMLLKFEIISIWTAQVIKFWNDIYFSETPNICKNWNIADT